MKRLMRATSLCILACGALASCAHQRTAPTAASLEAVVPRIASLFSACDLDGLVGRYASTIEFVSPSTPRPLTGVEEIRSYFAGACKGTTRPIMKVENQRIKLLTPSSAVITGSYSFGRTDRPHDKPWPAFFVITVNSDGHDWRIVTQATFPIPE